MRVDPVSGMTHSETNSITKDWVNLEVGDEVTLKGCTFKVEYINSGKERLSLVPVKKKVNEG